MKSAASSTSTALQELVSRSNHLASDRSVCNWGGGNTSIKTVEIDFRGESTEILWVKGSGSDLAEATEKSFTALRLSDIRPLLERDEMDDAEMVEYLSHCMLDKKHPRSSIETLLHAFLPFKHIDHTHPDSIISLCCTETGKEIAQEIFGKRMVWVPYIRPGFTLSKVIAKSVAANPDCELVLMSKHGLITWGETSEACYANTIRIIEEARDYISQRVNEKELFGGQKYEALPADERHLIATAILPLIRGTVSEQKGAILIYDDSSDFLQFANSHRVKELSKVGAACPDHLVHTKRQPLVIDWDPSTKDVGALKSSLQAGLLQYKEDYASYFERNKEDESQTMNDPYPRVIVVPGLGAIGTGKSKKMANIALALYHRAVSVIRGATTLGTFVSLSEKESFDVEYWPLELYKLSLAPLEKELSRKVAFVTGGAGGIGSATVRKLVKEGAHVVIADIALENAKSLASKINESSREEKTYAVYLDVTNEDAVRTSFQKAVLEFGGVDVFVSNAGLASSAPITETTLGEWNKNISVLGTGYFLTSREAFSIMKEQGIGGSIIFVTSKNAVYAGKNAAAYSSVKALESHLARCLSVEGGSFGIRVNSVLPDAVLQGSKIWSSRWKEERARAYGIKPEELEEHYRKRTILGVNVFPDDIAEAIFFFASSSAAKTTGCMLTVDGGVAAAFTR